MRNLLQAAKENHEHREVLVTGHLEVEFQVLPGTSEDPDDMRNAQANIWALVRDSIHGSLTEIEDRRDSSGSFPF